MEEGDLNKWQRRQLKKEQEREEHEHRQSQGKLTKLFIIVAVAAAIGFGLFRWVQGAQEVTSVGEVVADLGRDHVTDLSQITYNSNPPTSGSHFDVWAKPGVYSKVISDGHLLHSLEHGYVIVSYNCGEPTTAETEKLSTMSATLASAMSFFTADNVPETSVDVPESFNSPRCQELQSKLSAFYQANRGKRVIVVPRPSLDVSVALTAWTRTLRLREWDEPLAQKFVDAWNNLGPEKTVE